MLRKGVHPRIWVIHTHIAHVLNVGECRVIVLVTACAKIVPRMAPIASIWDAKGSGHYNIVLRTKPTIYRYH